MNTLATDTLPLPNYYNHIPIVIVCVVLLLILKFVSKIEMLDLKCPSPDINHSSCGEGNGKTYNGSKPNATDDTLTLLNKISIAGSAVCKDVQWRKSLLFGGISTLVIYILSYNQTYSCRQIIMACLVTTFIFYFGSNYYNYHHYKHIENNINSAVNLLKTRIDPNNKTSSSSLDVLASI